MWWTNWTIPVAYTPEQIRDTSDIPDHAKKLFKGRKMMYPCMKMIDATSIYIKGSIFDLRSIPTWHRSRICLVGDAAHAVTPPPLFTASPPLTSGLPQFRPRGLVGIGRYIPPRVDVDTFQSSTAGRLC